MDIHDDVVHGKSIISCGMSIPQEIRMVIPVWGVRVRM
jgi:hypothetical protein